MQKKTMLIVGGAVAAALGAGALGAAAATVAIADRAPFAHFAPDARGLDGNRGFGGHGGHGSPGMDRGDGGPGRDGRHGGPAETELTGEAADQVTAAVLAEYPGATIDRLETDSDGAAFEAHITLADGSEVEVKLDENYTITSTDTHEDRSGDDSSGTEDSTNN